MADLTGLKWVDVTSQGQPINGIGIGEGETQLYISGEAWATAWAGLDDNAYAKIGQGSPFALGPIGGQYPVLVTDDDIYWIDRDLTHYHSYRGAKIPIPIGPTTQGFGYFDYATRTIAFMDSMPAMKPRLYRHKSWECYLDPTGDRVLAGRIGGQVQVVAECYTPVGARIRELPDGSAMVATSLPSEPGSHNRFPPGQDPYFRAATSAPIHAVSMTGLVTVSQPAANPPSVTVQIPATAVQPGQSQSNKVPIIIGGALVLVWLMSEKQS